MLPQLWLERSVLAKWIAHSALAPLHHLCFFWQDEFLPKAACTGLSANPKQEQQRGKCTTSRMCDLFCSDPAFYPRRRQHCPAGKNVRVIGKESISSIHFPSIKVVRKIFHQGLKCKECGHFLPNQDRIRQIPVYERGNALCCEK